MEDQVKIELAKIQAKGIIAPVDPGGVMNASPVVWQSPSCGFASRRCLSSSLDFVSWEFQKGLLCLDIVSRVCISPTHPVEG